MSLVPKDLSDKIIAAARNEVQKCGGPSNFNPKSFDRMFYAKVVYDYITDNAEIKAAYTGSIPGVGPDPLSGVKTFKVESTGTYVITQEGNSYPASVNLWWSTFITSILITSKTTDTTKGTTDTTKGTIVTPVVTIVPFVGCPVPLARPDISDGNKYSSMESIWETLAKDIITNVKSITFPPSKATSSSGGTGTCSVVSII